MKSVYIIACVLLISCSNQTSEAQKKIGQPVSAPNAVETQQPNSRYSPAFQGQTRITGVKTASDYEAKIITSDLDHPWGIAVLPDGRMLVTEKSGTMRIVKNDGTKSEKITGIPKVHSWGQGGLLGIALDPSFERNRMIYWTFSEPRDDGNLTAVAKGKLSADEKQIENATVIYRATPAHEGGLHFGSRIVFDREGNLFVSFAKGQIGKQDRWPNHSTHRSEK